MQPPQRNKRHKGSGLQSRMTVNYVQLCAAHFSLVLTVKIKDLLRAVIATEVMFSILHMLCFPYFIAQNQIFGINGILLATLEIVPSQQSQGPRALSASPSPSIPLEPKALLGIPHTIFKQSLALRLQHSVSLYLYSEALAKCCFNSCYCRFSIDRVFCLPSL